METLGRLKTIVASLENGLELGDVPETLQWCIETIERLQKERDEARNEAHAWSQEALKQVGEALAERDAALAEVETAKAVENTLSMKIGDLQSSITRLEVSHNQLVQAAIKQQSSD